MKKNSIADNRILQLFIKYWPAIVIALVILGAVFSSVEIYKEEVLNINPDIEYEEQKTLYLAAERMDTLNPLVSQSEDTYYLSKLIYDSLFSYDENLGAVPDLVESYECNTEKASITLKLKEDVLWHDGKTLKAEDVRFTVNAIKAAGSSSPYYEKASKILAVNVIDTYRCSIYFRNNYNCSLDDLTFPIVPSGQYASAARFIQAKEGFEPVGTGVYCFKSYNEMKFLRLKPNKAYFGEKASNSIYVNLIPDRKLAKNLMEIEAVTCYMDRSGSRKSIATDKNYQQYDILSNQLETMVFNTQRGVFRDKKFRQAAAYAIDREKILSDAYMEDGMLSDTIYYPNFLGVADQGDPYAYDYETAQQIFEKAGYADRNGDGILQDPLKRDLSVKIVVNKKNATRTAAARAVSESLERLGIKTDLQILTTKEYQRAIARREFDILLTGYRIEESYDLRFLFDGTNPWKYTDYTLLPQVKELDRMHSAEEYKNIYQELKTQLSEELPYYPLCYKYIGLIGVSTFNAEKLPTFQDIYKNCSTWSWSKVVDVTKTQDESEEEMPEKES